MPVDVLLIRVFVSVQMQQCGSLAADVARARRGGLHRLWLGLQILLVPLLLHPFLPVGEENMYVMS